MNNEQNEEILVKAILSGDRIAFKKLVNVYEGLVNHISFSILNNKNDRADICQDVFLKVYTNLEHFEFRSKLSTWIGNITYNACINHLRKKKNLLIDDYLNNQEQENSEMDKFLIKDEMTPAKILINKEEINLLAAAVNKLAPVQKAVILLFHLDGLSLEEISGVINLPLNTIKSHLHRARRQLKEILTT